MADGDQMETFNGVVLVWLTMPAVSYISARFLVGSMEVKVKTSITTSADTIPSLEASSLCDSPSHRVVDNASGNLTLLGLASLCSCGISFLKLTLCISDMVVRLLSDGYGRGVSFFFLLFFFLSSLILKKIKKTKMS